MRGIFKILVFLFLLQGSLWAQHGNSKVEALRVEYISKRLELTPAEADKFWPIYNEYNDKLQAVKKNLRQAYRQKAQPLTDSEAEELYKLELQSHQTVADIHKLYGERLKVIVGVKKMVQLKIAEESFKRELIKTIKEGGE